MYSKEGKLGLIDKNGRWVLPAEYDTIELVERGETSYYKLKMTEPGNGTELYRIADMDGNIIGDESLI